MELLISKVPRSLELKTKIFGFELGDALLIFLYLAVSNLIFAGTSFKFLFVWVGTFALALGLYFLKKGKPERYLQDLGEFYRTPSVFTASSSDTKYQPYF